MAPHSTISPVRSRDGRRLPLPQGRDRAEASEQRPWPSLQVGGGKSIERQRLVVDSARRVEREAVTGRRAHSSRPQGLFIYHYLHAALPCNSVQLLVLKVFVNAMHRVFAWAYSFFFLFCVCFSLIMTLYSEFDLYHTKPLICCVFLLFRFVFSVCVEKARVNSFFCDSYRNKLSCFTMNNRKRWLTDYTFTVVPSSSLPFTLFSLHLN